MRKLLQLFFQCAQAYVHHMEVFCSTALGEAPARKEFESLSLDDKRRVLRDIIVSCQKELASAPKGVNSLPLTLMKLIDDAYTMFIQPLFLSHFGSGGTEKEEEWRVACNKYINFICRSSDAADLGFHKSMRKRLFYLIDIPIMGRYPDANTGLLLFPTRFPIFSHSVLQSIILMLAPRESKGPQDWHGFRILCQMVRIDI